MPEIKCVINDPKTGNSRQKNVDSALLAGRKIGDKIAGAHLGLEGYELQITGGSDTAGFPMRKEIDGAARKKLLLGKGVGFRINREGMKLRKTIVGNTISNLTAQVNIKVIKHGAKPFDELMPKQEKKE